MWPFSSSEPFPTPLSGMPPSRTAPDCNFGHLGGPSSFYLPFLGCHLPGLSLSAPTSGIEPSWPEPHPAPISGKPSSWPAATFPRRSQLPLLGCHFRDPKPSGSFFFVIVIIGREGLAGRATLALGLRVRGGRGRGMEGCCGGGENHTQVWILT